MLAFWIASVLIIIFGSLRRRDHRRREDFITALGYVALAALGAVLQGLMIKLRPHTIDPQLMRIDQAMGFNLNQFLLHVVHHRTIMVVLTVSYLILPIMMTTAWTLEQGIILRRTVLIGGLFCFVFYFAFPAVGPAWFDWSAASKSISSSPRNCVPSMHFAWAMMIAWNVRNHWLRFGLWFYAALIAVATLALGQHYLIDLIAALPYTVAVQWAALAWYRQRVKKAEFVEDHTQDQPSMAIES